MGIIYCNKQKMQ